MPRKKKIKKRKKISKTKKIKEKIGFKKSVRQSVYKSNIFKTNEEKIKIKKIEKQPTEKKIIKNVIVDLNEINSDQANELLKLAEEKERESNQIIEFTKEIKKYSMEFRLKIVEIIWKIVYSDGTNDDYESNLIRRICGLLYVSDKNNGIIKARVQNLSK